MPLFGNVLYFFVFLSSSLVVEVPISYVLTCFVSRQLGQMCLGPFSFRDNNFPAVAALYYNLNITQWVIFNLLYLNDNFLSCGGYVCHF